MTGVIRNGLASVIGLIATLVRVVCSVIGALIVVHAAFVLFDANPHNVLVQFTAGIRDTFGWFTKNLFTPKDAKIGQAINDALAGLIWVVVGNLASKLILRFAPAKKAKDKRTSETPRATPARQTPPAPKAQEQPAEAPKPQEAPPAKEEPRAQQAPEPEPERAPEPEPEPEPEPRSQARHAARATARRENPPEGEAEDEAAAEEPAGDRAQA
jgi:hypothetical protein